MAIIRLQGKEEQERGLYYEFNTATEPLGEGGMGKVYRGRMITSDGRSREVAIKFMFDGLPESVIDRAKREAEIRIHHENLVEMMGFLTTQSQGPNGEIRNHYHVVSELLTGVMLADLLDGVTTLKNGEQLPYAQKLYKLYNGTREEREEFAIIVMKSILSGIMSLHDNQYIHRDIDPTNIMVTKDGKIKLIDFGIAKQLNNLKTQDRALTASGQFMGKAQYAAPELAVGDVQHQNKTTDIYELGILFYQLLQGHLPFEGSTTSVLNHQIHTKTPVKEIENPYFARVIAMATEKEQDNRFQTAAEFRVAVEQLEEKIGKTRGIADLLPKKAWMGLGIFAVIGLLVAFFLLIPVIFGPPPAPEGYVKVEDVSRKANIDPFTHLKKNLYDSPDSAKVAIRILESQKDAESLFLLSRIYYKQANSGGLPDSIVKMQLNLQGVVEQNNQTAHKLLEETVEKDPNHYKALYELGLDYYAGDVRGTSRNLEWAKKLFERSRDAAKKAGDAVFAQYPESQLNNF